MKRFVFFLGFCILTAGCSRLTLATPGELRIENRSDARIESVKVSVNGEVKAEVSGEATSGVIWSPDYPFPGRGSQYRIEIQLSGSTNYFIDKTFVYGSADDLVFVLNGDYSLQVRWMRSEICFQEQKSAFRPIRNGNRKKSKPDFRPIKTGLTTVPKEW